MWTSGQMFKSSGGRECPGTAYRLCEPIKTLRETKEKTLIKDGCGNYFMLIHVQ